jgi:hypothetical protein
LYWLLTTFQTFKYEMFHPPKKIKNEMFLHLLEHFDNISYWRSEVILLQIQFRSRNFFERSLFKNMIKQPFTWYMLLIKQVSLKPSNFHGNFLYLTCNKAITTKINLVGCIYSLYHITHVSCPNLHFFL